MDVDTPVFQKPSFCMKILTLILSVFSLKTGPFCFFSIKCLPKSHIWIIPVCISCFQVKGGVSWKSKWLIHPTAWSHRCFSWKPQLHAVWGFCCVLPFHHTECWQARAPGPCFVKIILLLHQGHWARPSVHLLVHFNGSCVIWLLVQFGATALLVLKCQQFYMLLLLCLGCKRADSVLELLWTFFFFNGFLLEYNRFTIPC